MPGGTLFIITSPNYGSKNDYKSNKENKNNLINTDQIEKTHQKPWCTWNPVYFKLISMVTFSVISDSQKLSVSPSVANSIGCAVSAKRDTESVAFPSKFFRHFAGSAALILGCVGGQRQWLAT